MPMDYSENYDALIFDCDGTLTDSMPVHFVALRDTLLQHGVRVSSERFYSLGGMPTVRVVAKLAEEQGVGLDPVSVAGEKEALFESMLDQIGPMEHVCTIAEKHHGRIPMGVASGSGRTIVLRQLSSLELTDLFAVVVAAEDTERHKPEPDVFLETARRLGVRADRCLVFEDSPLGIQAAEAAGMDSVDIRNLNR